MSSATRGCTAEDGPPSLSDCGRLPKNLQDDLDLYELLAEVWVTAGVAGPLFLVIITLVLAMTPDGGAPLGGWLPPVLATAIVFSFLAILEVVGHPLRHDTSATNSVRAQIESQLRVPEVVILFSGIIAVVVLAMIDTMFIAKMSGMPPSSDFSPHTVSAIREPVYVTMVVLAAGSGLAAGTVRDGSIGRRVIYALSLVTVALFALAV